MSQNNNLVFEQTNDPEVIHYTYRNVADQWAGKLTPDQYTQREIKLSEAKVNKRTEFPLGGYVFVLRDLSLPSNTKTRNIVASVEILNRKAWRVDGPNGELKEVTSSVIGNVFTVKEHRRKGYASVMMKFLNDAIDEQVGRDGYSYLYSELGSYYERFGYRDFQVPTHYIPIEDVETGVVDNESYEFLKYEGYEELIKAQQESIQAEINQRKTSIKENDSIVSIIPTLDLYTWFHVRDIFIASKVRPELKIEKFGAVLSGTKDHVIWLHDWNSDQLFILKIFIEEGENASGNFKKLIEIAIEDAKAHNLRAVFVWDTSLGKEGSETKKRNTSYLGSFSGAKMFEENDSKSSLRLENAHWVCNEKWNWF